MATQDSTQHFVPIKNIRDDVVMLKSGQYCMVLLASSINFSFKSDDEQQAILSQFQSFLNSIEFSIQIYVQSRRMDMRPYLTMLREREHLQDSDLMRVQLREYIEFINSFTAQINVMRKQFFVVVPYTPTGIEVGGVSKFFSQKKQPTDDEKFFEHRTQLEQRVAVVEQGLGRIGIRAIPLATNDLIEMYYHIFNPEDAGNAPQTTA